MLALAMLAVGLAMDACAAALAEGASSRATGSRAFKIAAAFGSAQAIMPLAGWALGVTFTTFVSRVDHWIALVLLGGLGLRMIREALHRDEVEQTGPRLRGWALVTAAIATSIDAAAAGVTLPAIGQPVLLACGAIGATTAALSLGSVYLGAAAGVRAGVWGEIFGGLLLILLGVKIFVEHQFLGG